MERSVFSKRLRQAIFVRGIRQTDLCTLTGIDKGSMSSYVNGRYKPNAEAITKLANALRVTPEWLLGEGSDDVAKMTREEMKAPDLIATLSEEEMVLIERFRAADEPRKQIVRLALGMTSVP